jgi:hypothetical protein
MIPNTEGKNQFKKYLKQIEIKILRTKFDIKKKWQNIFKFWHTWLDIWGDERENKGEERKSHQKLNVDIPLTYIPPLDRARLDSSTPPWKATQWHWNRSHISQKCGGLITHASLVVFPDFFNPCYFFYKKKNWIPFNESHQATLHDSLHDKVKS